MVDFIVIFLSKVYDDYLFSDLIIWNRVKNSWIGNIDDKKFVIYNYRIIF